MILFIDGYDSFTWDLYQYFRELGMDMLVKYSDALMLVDVDTLRPQEIAISPGLCASDGIGISLGVIRYYAGRLPILDVYLSHQVVARALGDKVVRAAEVIYDKASPIMHNSEGVFRELASPLIVTCYHSLVMGPDSLPVCFDMTTWGGTQEIMGIRHRQWGLESIRSYPESILNGQRHRLLANFLHR